MRTGCVIAIAIALGFSSVGRTEKARDVRAEDPATEVTAPLTPEQLEIGRVFLDGLEWFVSAVVHEFLTANESVEMVEEDFFELEAIVDDKLEASRPVFKSQILLLKKVGNLSEAEFATINECGEFSLREVVRNYLIQEMRTEAQEVDENSTPVLTPSLPRRIQDVVVELAKSQLSSDQLRRYVEELAARSVQRKRVAVLNLVAQLDGDLLLTPAQRDQFSKLIEHGDEWFHCRGSRSPGFRFNRGDHHSSPFEVAV